MENIFLIAVTIAVLSSSLLQPSQAMPLSWSRSSRHRRSFHTGPSPTEAPPLGTEDEGRLHQTPVAPGDLPPGGGGGGADNSTAHRISLCMEECYAKLVPSNLPRSKIDNLKRTALKQFLSSGIHPGFLMSQWLENYHRFSYCSGRSENDTQCNLKPQALGDIVNRMNATLRTEYGYTVLYEPESYPRYYIQVNCTNTATKEMPYLKFEDGTWDIQYRNENVCL